jgi:hypothetical protein
MALSTTDLFINPLYFAAIGFPVAAFSLVALLQYFGTMAWSTQGGEINE